MIFRPKDAEFQVELEDTIKCIDQKLPKQRDSNGRSVLFLIEIYNLTSIIGQSFSSDNNFIS